MNRQALDELMATPAYAAFCRAELTDPYDLLQELRTVAPVHWSAPLGSWVITTYEEVSTALRDPRLAHDRIEINTRGIPEGALRGYGALVTHVSNWLGFTDPPKHTRMREIGRKLVNPALARRLRPWIKSFASDVVARVEAADHVDLVDEVALRLPLELICEALGMRGDDVGRFHAWSGDVGLFAGRMSPAWDPEAQLSLDRSLASWLELESMFRRLMDDKRRDPEDDLLTELVHYFDNGTVSEEEVIGLAVFILAAGHGTSRDLIASALYLLLTHPSEAARLAAGPNAIASAVEEVLRYESPIPVLSQLAAEDVTFAGETVHAGESVMLHLGSANRDSERFDRAEVFDVTRTDRHLAFGYGGHFCLGAPLARQTAAAVLEELEPFLSHLVLEPEPPRWRTGDFSGRSLISLNASWSGHPRYL